MFGFLKRMTQQPYASDYWWNAETVAVVTGGNKGIGNEIAKVLAQQELHVILTARDPKLGTKAAEDIKGHVTFHQLDITDQTSVDSFATWLKNKYGGVTILVNNAGIAYKGDIFGAEEAQTTINTNYLGTRRVCEAMNPLLTQNARIVNVGSRAGVLRIVSPQLQQKIQSVKTVEEVDQLANDFISSIKDDTVQQKGWRKSMYGVSKLLEHAYTQVLSAELKDKGVMVNAVCPGYIATDMTSWGGTAPVSVGADTPVWLALRSPTQFVTGKFFAERSQIPF